MTLPRQFLPGTTYFITRRCTQRQFWLKPTKQTTQIFLYCLAVAAERTGVVIHAVCVMSNHYHIIISDPQTRAAEFYAWVHKYVAKAVNASLGRWENLWSSEKTSVIALDSQADVMDKLIYSLCNPVEAGLVAAADKWPGVWLYKASHSQTIRRPEAYFRDDGTMPEQAKLNIEPPPQFAHLPAQQFESLVETALHAREQEIREGMKANGHSFMGIRAVMQQLQCNRPKNCEPRRGLDPRIAAKNKWQRIEAIRRHKVFQFEYRQAFKSWQAGVRDILFPAGTYALRVFAGVKCHPG